MSKDYIDLLRQSYKKLKSSIYFDKTQLILRDKIVRWESEEILTRRLKRLQSNYKKILSKNCLRKYVLEFHTLLSQKAGKRNHQIIMNLKAVTLLYSSQTG